MTLLDDTTTDDQAPASQTEVRFVLDTVPHPGPWMQGGACRTAPSRLFFIERGEDATPAKRICAKCGVREQCLAYALDAGHDLHGIWGGTSDKERRRLRRDRNQAVVDITTRRRDAIAARSLHAVLEQLTHHPGKWAIVQHFDRATSATSTASLLRTGRRPVPPGSWEFQGRRNPDGGSDLYALYLDDAHASSTPTPGVTA